ncbi:hypothetical protein [Ligilactobacillus animalis]|uniref:hypothetical protein n=1 Tax=Ligilactobacillus animalis TaxID=1605 RepID=UPI0002194B12|nr:hypothetical protein [Ligilactobacillus animalis]OCX49480.1 hypothetical protein BFC98_00990 [Ligilactobacillus animalis]QHQ70611.1 hypothetical protein GSR62_07855 [Ligilactobacillus animalis]
MAIDNFFKESVKSGNRTKVVVSMKDSILLDPTLKLFDEKLQFAMGKIPNLIEEHDGETFKSEDEWTEKYLYDVLADLTFNFSQERIDFLHQLAPTVKKGEETVNKKNTKSQKNPSSRGVRHKENSKQDTQKIAGTVTAVAGAITTAAGLATAHTALTISGACVTIAGVAIALVDNSKE